MSSFHPGRQRMQEGTIFQNQSSHSQHQFICVSQRYHEKTMKQAEEHKRMDMIFNYMIKNDVKIEKKSDIKQQKIRKTRKDKEGRKFICGCEGRPGYLSYPALYTHIKTKHNGITPQGTIRGESGKPKKRGRPKVRKTPQIYEREIEKNEFPKELSGLLQEENLDILQQFDEIERGEDEQPQLAEKYFVSIVRELKKVHNVRIYLLPIDQVITVFLQNTKQFLSQSILADFERIFLDLIAYANRRYSTILADYQLVSKYYVDCDLKDGQVYCEVERPTYLPIIIQRFMWSELSAEDELQQSMLIDFSKWLGIQQLTSIKIHKESNSLVLNE